MVFLTVFTPAYNRAHTLPRTYESLLRQSNKNFLWLIVDDGSTDGTGDLVRAWQSRDNGFDIRYIYQENGGMHTAHNTAYAHIDTELNVCIDSDDCLADGAVDAIYRKWDSVRNRGYAGLIGLDADLRGNLIGKGFPEGMRETTLCGYYAAGGAGDKKLVYRTDVIKKYLPYPVFPGEKYVALAYVYRRIDQDWKLAVLDTVLCNVEYQPDGHGRTMWTQYYKNPKGFACWRKLCMHYPQSRKRLVVDAIHYAAESLLAGNRNFVKESPRKTLVFCMIPAGIVLKWYILWKIRPKKYSS